MTEPVRIQLARNAAARSALTIVGCFQDTPPETGNLTSPMKVAVSRAAGRSAWKGRAGQRSEAEISGRTPGTVILHGLGGAAEFDRNKLRRWVRRLAIEVRSHGTSSAQIVLPEHEATVGFDHAESLLRELMHSDYRFDGFKRGNLG
jgi:hypothetical protein